MFARRPAMGRYGVRRELQGCAFQTGGHGVVPSVEKPKKRDDRHDFHHLIVIEMFLEGLKVLVRHHPGRAAERKVAGSGGFLHAGVGRIAVVLSYGSCRITGNFFFKSALLEQLAKSCLGGRRATNVSPTNKKDMHPLVSTS